MKVRASEIVKEALSWVNTPFAHQGHIKGVGVDCVNFIAEVARVTNATPDVEFERNYRQRSDGSQMLAELMRYMEPVESLEGALPGDVLALCDEHLKDKGTTRHLGFLTQTEPRPMIDHASERGVHHHIVNLHFRRRIVSIWRVPNVIHE